MTNITSRFAFVTLFIALTATCRLSQTTHLAQNEQGNQNSPSSMPPRKGLVNDYSNVLDQSSGERLESTLSRLRQRSGVEFVVVIVNSTGDQPIEDYSSALIRKWGLDPKDDKDAKVLLLVAVKDYQWRFNITKALWNDLPDAKLEEFGSLMKDSFSEEKYGEGLLKGVDAVIATLTERHRGRKTR